MESKEQKLEEAYKFYPKKEGKYMGMQVLMKVIKTQQHYDELLVGIKNFAKKIEIEGTEKRFIPLFSTFCNQRRWLDYQETENAVSDTKWF